MSKADVQSGTVAGMSRLGVSSLLTLVVLLGVSLLGFFSRLFAVIRFEVSNFITRMVSSLNSHFSQLFTNSILGSTTALRIKW